MKRLTRDLYHNLLAVHTPESWAEAPLADLPALLSDHAYLERKAASNALELLNRWPEPRRPKAWTSTMAAVARDEALHLHQVLRFMQERGIKLERLHRSAYAGDLRKLVRLGEGPREVIDRLLVSALIEARSCERFQIISRCATDKTLARFYKALAIAERGHYTVFLKLAKNISEMETQTRWAQMIKAEGIVIQAQPLGPGLHSGWN